MGSKVPLTGSKLYTLKPTISMAQLTIRPRFPNNIIIVMGQRLWRNLFASYAVLMRPKKAKKAVHDC